MSVRAGVSLLFLLAAAIVLLLMGEAHAAPVTVDWTYPLYNASPGCGVALGDTCKDLSTFVLYAQRQGATDSTLVYTEPAVGKQGRPGTATFDLGQGMWSLWARCWNLGGTSSCRSPAITRVVFTAPAAPTLR